MENQQSIEHLIGTWRGWLRLGRYVKPMERGIRRDPKGMVLFRYQQTTDNPKEASAAYGLYDA